MTAAPHIAVVGAGVVGLVTALELARRGASLTLFDEGLSSNASSVAAGMLAPSSEAALEGGDAAMFARLLAARDLWPDLARSVGVSLERRGAEMVVDDASALEGLQTALARAAIPFSRLHPPRLGVRLPDDWRIDPVATLQALRRACASAGVRFSSGRVDATREGFRVDSRRIIADGVVIAAGFGARAFAPLVPELAVLHPIKGQIAIFDSQRRIGGPTLRAPGLYLTPQAAGARAGATMEAGRDDARVEPMIVADLAKRAAALEPSLADAAFQGAAGVRAATPDGWPLVGPSRTTGVLLAVGARRNGWLLAPMIAQLLADHVEGRASGELADAFHPGRFTR